MEALILADKARRYSLAHKHTQIIDKLDQCKVVSVKDLFKVLNYPVTYNSFRKIIRRLESQKIVGSFVHGVTREKYIYFEKEIGKHFSTDSLGKVNQETLFHDSIVTKLMLRLYELDYISYFALEHNFESVKSYFQNFQKIKPDSIGFSKNSKLSRFFKKNSILKFAFEIEIYSKSRTRLFEKLIEYSEFEELDQVIYIFTSENVYQSYILRLREFYSHSTVSTRKNFLFRNVTLVYSPELIQGDFNLKTIQVYNLSGKNLFSLGL